MKKIVLLLLFSGRLLGQQATAPVKPTPVEFLLGNDRVQGQTIIIKNFGKSDFGIFSLTTLAGDYRNADPLDTELFSNVQLNYDVYKGLKVTAGATFNPIKGMAPITGLEYVLSTKKITVVINPTIELTKNRSLATFGQAEYAPKNDKLNPYLRLQGLYVASLAHREHERSAAVLRAGISYRGFAGGLGFNKDFYGPPRIAKNNTGIFLQYKFF